MRTVLEAYAQIYDAHISELYSYCIGLGYPKSVCMDAIHDVFCKLVVDGREPGSIVNMKFYLFRSVKNRLLDIRKRSKKVTYDDPVEFGFRAEVTVAEDIIVDREERDRVVAKVRALMDELTDAQREAVYLRYIQEMGYEEIAGLLNITPESVRKLVYRALEKMRQQKIGVAGFIIMMHLLKNSLHS